MGIRSLRKDDAHMLLIVGNTFEGHGGDAIRSQTVSGVLCSGNYFEDNDGDNIQLGGTNGTDFCIGWNVTSSRWPRTTGSRWC